MYGNAFGYDPEAIYQDADIEMIEASTIAAEYADEPCNAWERCQGHDYCLRCGWPIADHS